MNSEDYIKEIEILLDQIGLDANDFWKWSKECELSLDTLAEEMDSYWMQKYISNRSLDVKEDWIQKTFSVLINTFHLRPDIAKLISSSVHNWPNVSSSPEYWIHKHIEQCITAPSENFLECIQSIDHNTVQPYNDEEKNENLIFRKRSPLLMCCRQNVKSLDLNFDTSVKKYTFHTTHLGAAERILKYGINKELGSDCLDFGKGFYLYHDWNDAVKFKNQKQAAILIFDVIPPLFSLKGKMFNCKDAKERKEWKKMVRQCRQGLSNISQYCDDDIDYISGPSFSSSPNEGNEEVQTVIKSRRAAELLDEHLETVFVFM